MKIDYQKIFKKNITNILKDVLKDIEKNGLKEGHHLYITFLSHHKGVSIPKWLKEKYPQEITIIIQYEYYNLKVNEDYFLIGLSFDNIKTDLKINFNAIVSFADPYANFGLKLIEQEQSKKKNVKNNSKKYKNKKINNVIDLKTYKKN